jgi:hypothetical protein
MNDLALTTTETARLSDLETKVSTGLASFIEVGEALSEIRDARLYRASHGTFEDYCREKWGISRPRAYQMIQAAQSVSTIVDKAAVTTESQARELSRVEPEQRQAVVEKAQAATGGKITAAAIREAARPEPQVIEMTPAPRRPSTKFDLEGWQRHTRMFLEMRLDAVPPAHREEALQFIQSFSPTDGR